MKNWISKLTLALLLTLTFALPAFAWQDHGNTYTAIDGLDSQRLTTQGEVSLPTLSEQFSMGLHVDIIASVTMRRCFMTSMAMGLEMIRTALC